MVERDDLVATYSVDYVAGVMSLRKPQKESLSRLEKIWNAADIRKGADMADNLARVKELYPLCKDFERAFPSLAFALATGVGKTRLMGAFITWLYAQKGVKNFFVVAPGMTVYEKLKSDFGDPNSPKYVFKGVGCFTASPPVIVADDDYRQKRLSFTDSSVRIFIFNIDKFNKEDAAMRTLQETLGQSFYGELAALDDLVVLMDESHHYRADRGMAALNDLKPILGLELTATPKTVKNGKEQKFKNVVYEYPLRDAIADGYTRTPYALTRKNVDFDNLGDEERDKLMLGDGIRSHERTRTALEVYADENEKPRVKPFVLVVCKDTDHAKWVADYVTSDQFCGGKYRNKTITVHSKLKGAESEENMRLLLDVERSDNPVEIVIHVNMLKEGWDVNNLYTIIPLRTAASAVLREQMVGRGLRLPYGERTGCKEVDAVTLTAHDKFDELLREAQSGESIFKAGCIIKSEDEDGEATDHRVSQPNLSFEPHDAAFDAAVEQAGKKADSASNEARIKIVEAMSRETVVAMAKQKSTALDAMMRKAVVKAAVEKAAKDADVAACFDPANHVFDDWTEKVSQEIVVKTADKFIPIPRLRITDCGVERIVFQPFEMDFAPFVWQPTDNELLEKNLKDLAEDVRILDGGRIDFSVYDPARELVRELRDKPEIDYAQHREVLAKLITDVCAYFRGEFGEDGARNVIVLNRIAIADEIFNQMLRHMVRENGLVTEEIVGADKTNLPTHFNWSSDKTKDMHMDAFAGVADGSIKKYVFTGAKKGVFGEFKVDSFPELAFARTIDTDPVVSNWLRPAARQFELVYNGSHQYEPDFVVETENDIYLVEIKRHDQVEDDDVKAKRARAVTYCQKATTWAKANGYKPWTHLFIPDNEVRAERLLADYAKLFTVEKGQG